MRAVGTFTHNQVPFVTKKGVVTTVDEGLLYVLTLLKDLGVETQFSCQGDFFGAYVNADTPTFRPVILEALKRHREGSLSDSSMIFMYDFLYTGLRELTLDRRLKSEVRFADEEGYNPQCFSYERELKGLRGPRTTIRWPKDRTVELQNLLVEILDHAREKNTD